MNEVDAQTLHRMMVDGGVLVVDVREADEYAAQHIEGVHFMPLSAFNPHELPPANGRKVVFQCRSGARSQRALQVYDAFYPEVETFNFKGGILGWMEAGFPVVEGAGQ